MRKDLTKRFREDHPDPNIDMIGRVNQMYYYTNEYVIWLEQQLPIAGVSQQRELLSRFLKQYNQKILTACDEMDIDLFLDENKPT